MSDFRKRVFDFVMDLLDAGYPPTCPIGACPERDSAHDAPTIGDVRALLTTSDGSLPWVFVERTPAYWLVTLERFRDKLTATAAPHLPDGLAVGEVMRAIKPEIAELLERAEAAEAEVSRLRADAATLRERVKALPSPLSWHAADSDGEGCEAHIHCAWCGHNTPADSLRRNSLHHGTCLYAELASAPKEPTQ